MVSISSVQGNNQKGSAFWESVLVNFHARLKKAPYRINDGLNGKWRELNHKCTKFNGIYNNLNGQKQQRDTTHFNVYRVTLERFLIEEKNPFTSLRAWEVLRVNAKWLEVNAFSKSKSQSKQLKSYTSTEVSEARTNIDLNDNIDEIPDFEPP